MKAQKVRDLDDNELRNQLREMDEQMFRLQFQMRMGQMEGLKKVREHEEGPGADADHPARAGTGGSEEIRWPKTAKPRQAFKNEKVGEVVSTKMAKTIVVEVSRRVPHPLYKRIIDKRKKFYAHDEEGTAKMGDVVRIIECRPLSKLKRWRLAEVVRRAAAGGRAADGTGRKGLARLARAAIGRGRDCGSAAGTEQTYDWNAYDSRGGR